MGDRRNYPLPSLLAELPETYREELAERFWSKVLRGPGCWPWRTYVTPQGYAHFSVKGRMRKAHRVAYELVNGPASISDSKGATR